MARTSSIAAGVSSVLMNISPPRNEVAFEAYCRSSASRALRGSVGSMLPWVRHGTPGAWPVVNALCMYAIGRVMLTMLLLFSLHLVAGAGVGELPAGTPQAVVAAKASPTHAQTHMGVSTGSIGPF